MKKRKTLPDGGTREGWDVLVFTLKYEISKQIDPLFYTFFITQRSTPTDTNGRTNVVLREGDGTLVQSTINGDAPAGVNGHLDAFATVYVKSHNPGTIQDNGCIVCVDKEIDHINTTLSNKKRRKTKTSTNLAVELGDLVGIHDRVFKRGGRSSSFRHDGRFKVKFGSGRLCLHSLHLFGYSLPPEVRGDLHIVAKRHMYKRGHKIKKNNESCWACCDRGHLWRGG